MTTPEQPNGNLPIWPFLLVDALFLGLAALIFWNAHRPLDLWDQAFLILSGALAAASIIYPVARRYRDQQATSQVQVLANTVSQINRMDQVAAQIAQATSQWQTVQEYATKVSSSSREVAQSISSQVAQFSQIFEKANDSEKNHLRLEIEKLRRGEIEWLQVTTRMLDHVYALFSAAERSGQRNIIDQIAIFQEACRDAARKVGLVAIVVPPNEKFDPNIHQTPDEQAQLPENAVVQVTLVTGFSFQGQLIRRAVVAVGPATTPAQPAPEPPQPTTGELGLA